MTIGDFSRATRLSAKTLRFYHREGLLEPSWVDPTNGYRFYTTDQISDAQVIRHFRSLDMPIVVIREVLASPGPEERNALIAEHLSRMETQLRQTQAAVASLRNLLAPLEVPLAVSHRSLPATPALVIRGTIELGDLGDWFAQTTLALERAADSVRAEVAGPRGGIWSTELFLDERGSAAIFRPLSTLAAVPDSVGGAAVELLPAVDVAVATHHGTDDTIAQVYAALGEYVTTHALGVDGPIRETYLHAAAGGDGTAVTEIGWPISHTSRLSPEGTEWNLSEGTS